MTVPTFQQLAARAASLVAAPAAEPMTMTTREIAELTGKLHKNVLRDADAMLAELEIDRLSFELVESDAKGEARRVLTLPKDLTLTLVTGYKVVLRHRIMQRWLELEARQVAPQHVMPMNYGEALRQLADQTDARDKLAAQLLRVQHKEEAFGTLVAGEEHFDLTGAAKHLDLNPQAFIRRLLQLNWIYNRRRGARYYGFQDKLDSGLVSHKMRVYTEEGVWKLAKADKLFVTSKGMVRLAELFAQWEDRGPEVKRKAG
jgi:phage regulator Rha-like protein